MSQKITILMASIVALGVTSCSGQVPSDGFKDLKYGTSLPELKTKDFDCERDEIFCSQSPDSTNNYTLFGKEASVHVETSRGNLSAVHVSINVSYDELIKLFTKELGEPKTFSYRSMSGTSKRYYWTSGSKSSVSITPTNRVGIFGPISSVKYHGPSRTKELIEEASDNSIQDGDY